MADHSAPGAALAAPHFLYRRPAVLDAEIHAGLGFALPERPFVFAAGENLMPLLMHEIAAASQWYPVIFAGERRLPLAVMGIRPGRNLFIGRDGGLAPGAYVPAYVRRYPFTLAEAAERLLVCIDTEAEHLRTEGGEPLFERGEPAPALHRAIAFCNEFERGRQQTLRVVELLQRHDLFESKRTLYTPNRTRSAVGGIKSLAEYDAVSEERLRALPAAVLGELAASGALGQIYAHLHSLQRWESLVYLHRAAGARR